MWDNFSNSSMRVTPRQYEHDGSVKYSEIKGEMMQIVTWNVNGIRAALNKMYW